MGVDLFKLTLRSYITNFPIMAEWKKLLRRPLALVFDDFSEAGDFVGEIAYAPIIVTAEMKTGKMQEIFEEINSTAAFLFLPKCKKLSAKEGEKVKLFCDVAVTQEFLGKPVIGAMIFICNRRLPEELTDMAAAFHIVKPHSTVDYKFFDLVPNPPQLELVRDKIGYLPDCGDDVAAVLSAAAMFMYPRLKDNGDELADCLETFSQSVLEEKRMYGDEADILEMGVERFFECVENGDFDKYYKLPNLGNDAIEQLNTAVFIKSGILYVHADKFEKIMQPLLQIFELSAIKRALIDAEILMADYGGYTKKMNYYNVYGKAERIRMMAFDMKKICRDDGAKLLYFFD